MNRRRRWLTALAVVGIGPAAWSAVPAHAEEVTFIAPAEHGLVFDGETVRYQLSGPCDALEVSVSGGPVTAGCSGEVKVPAGAGDPVLVASSAGEQVADVSLRSKRIEAETATVVAGNVTEVSAGDDPFSPSTALEVTVPGTTLSLGTIDTTGVSSVALRAAASPSVCHPSYEDGAATYCRAGEVVLTAASPDGPRLAVVEIPGSAADRPWKRTVSEPVRISSPGPVEVFATVVGTGARLNYFEFNGSGAAEPHRFGPDPAGTVSLLDDCNDSLDGWQMAGTGSFACDPDGSIRSVAGYGLFWYSAQAFGDGTYRLEFKVDSPDANSGVFVRFADPAGNALDAGATGYEVQIQDYGQAYLGTSDSSQTGAIYARQAASRLATRTVGEWNTLEVHTVGQRYTVTLNGETVNDFTGDRRLAGFVGVQNHDPSGTVWFRDIRFSPEDQQ